MLSLIKSSFLRIFSFELFIFLNFLFLLEFFISGLILLLYNNSKTDKILFLPKTNNSTKEKIITAAIPNII